MSIDINLNALALRERLLVRAAKMTTLAPGQVDDPLTYLRANHAAAFMSEGWGEVDAGKIAQNVVVPNGDGFRINLDAIDIAIRAREARS